MVLDLRGQHPHDLTLCSSAKLNCWSSKGGFDLNLHRDTITEPRHETLENWCWREMLVCRKVCWKTARQIPVGGKRVYIPLPPSQPGGLKQVTAMNEFECLYKIGSLLYASKCCSPDLPDGVSTVALANKQRHQIHCFKLKRVMKYLLQTTGKHLCYGSQGSDLVLRAYCDASFRSTLKADPNQRSSYGWVFTLGGYPISWCAKSFDSTSLNVCEAEMMAIKETTTQAIHLQALLTEFVETEPPPTMVHTNSKVSHDSLISSNFSKRLEHVTITCLWVHEQLASGIIDVKYVHMHQNLLISSLIPCQQ